MPRRRRQEILLGVLVLVLAGVLGWRWQERAGGGPAPTPSAPAALSSRAQPPAATVPEVGLKELQQERPEPVEALRDPFRFEVKRPPPPSPMPAGGATPPGAETLPPPSPPPPPPPPPIPFKFIGLVDSQTRPNKLAVLSDGREVFYGREGDIIDGRYRILKIGVESIELAYLDGRGRTTIRLSGG
jgi:hypothetical protein